MLADEQLSFIAEGRTMIVGLDVTHPAPGEDRAPSVAAIVASVDKHLGQWPADIRVQARREEMVQNLGGMFKSRLKLWQKRNGGTLPEKIVIYRDGVSEGQYDLVLSTELPQIRHACADLYPLAPAATAHKLTTATTPFPHITIVIVGKRHHTRFYPTPAAVTAQAVTPNGNPPSGTVVDRGVTESRTWDFYLQSHAAIHGTARPAHYVVVYDQIFRYPHHRRPPPAVGAADALQTLTHNLCYLFGRATKAVSVCPPAYYADIACERARCWIAGGGGGGLAGEATSMVSGEGGESGGGGGGAGEVEQRHVTVHPDLRDTMFYI